MRKAFLLLFVMLLVTAVAGASDAQKEQVNAAIERFNAGYTLTADEFQLLKSVDFQFSQGPVIDYAGGPDAYGYIFADIDEPDGPTYLWYDISATGTDIAPNLSDDDVEGPLPIGFTFNFYGVPYTDFYVHSNGVIGFTGGFTAPYTNAALPGTFPGPVIAWCWDDFDVNSGVDGSVYYETITDFEPGVDALIVSYVDCAHFSGPASGIMSGQTILLEDGRIITQYDYFDANWPVDSQTIGLRNADGSIFLQADYNTSPANYPYDDLAIEFSVMAGDANCMGYVTDSVTGDPIAGADVMVGNGMDVTDATGYYEVFDQFSGDNNVTINATGYFTYFGAVVLDPGNNDYDFQLDALPPPVSGDYFTDFEANQGFFDGTGTWEWGTPTASPTFAYSGDNCWATVLGGNYNNNDDDWLTSVTSFEANDATATLSYYHYLDYENSWDGYNFQISFDGGDTWQVIDPVGGYPDDAVVGLDNEPGFTAQSDWAYVEFDFSMYVGQPFWVAFRHGTDGSVNGYSGVAIDDFFWYAGYEFQVLLTPLAGTTVPGSGGVIQYGAELINNIGTATQFDAWTWATMPDGSTYGPIQQVPVVIQPGSTVISPLALQVPGMAPTGLYTYHAAIGDFPSTIVYEDVFYFWKVGFGAMGGAWADSDWALAMNGLGSNIELPVDYEVASVYPNPFNPTANVQIALPDAADLSVRVYNINGQLVAELANGQFEAGHHNLVLDGSSLASGLYFVHTQVPGQLNNVQKVTLMK